ncbi:DUF5368 family protein [Aquamicrobium segne]|uniref:Uncharacterized protein n=2 Tax=Aquamicrobium TaxID=69278 RepID=A0A4R6YEW5_9HYPH|nr:DUF5368 family protein [Aquamicrobium defluvii]TDR34808.1 hypothetical protein DES43_11220 [Aquamicrobium defluvii]
MSDFDLTTIYFILSESMGGWLWGFVALALLLLAAIVAGIMTLRKNDTPARRPLVAALVAGLVTTIIFTFLVPIWTLAGAGALAAPIDVLFAVLFALVPGGVVGSAVFVIMAFASNRRVAAIA